MRTSVWLRAGPSARREDVSVGRQGFPETAGCATIARHRFRMRQRRRFYITMGLEDRAFQEKLRELGIERPGK